MNKKRYQIAQIIALAATGLSLLGWILYFAKTPNAISNFGMILSSIGFVAGVVSYCFGGLLTALKSAWKIATVGWLITPFPIDIFTGLMTFFIGIFVFMYFPILPVRKAYKENEEREQLTEIANAAKVINESQR